jgi:iron-sulfur cluster insertion protein
MSITVTDNAAKEIKKIIEEEKPTEKLYLRIRVVGGGCSGYTNKIELDENVTEKDQKFELNGIDVVVDNRSMLYLDGSTIDFVEEINDRGFSIKNPNAKSTCGCGSSWSM